MPNRRLLLIEDDYDVAEMLLMYFATHQYEVIHADTGAAGIVQARLRFPNLILLDVMLPDMDGYDVCRQIRQTSFTRYIPVIFLTQRDERANKVRGLELGADDYITKPFDIDELRLRVQGSINRATRESLHELRTGLPTGPLVEDELSRRQRSGQPFTSLRLKLQGFKDYSDVYGFMAASEVLAFAARSIQQTISEEGTPDDFVGISGDQFVILTHTDNAGALDQRIRSKFNDGIHAFYSFKDVELGGLTLNAGTAEEQIVPLMQLSSG
jgi:DNA-binding response OmpR family regulator